MENDLPCKLYLYNMIFDHNQMTSIYSEFHWLEILSRLLEIYIRDNQCLEGVDICDGWENAEPSTSSGYLLEGVSEV